MAQYKPNKPKAKKEHNITKKVGRTGYFSCWHCGLIRLNNPATAKAIAKGCVDDAEPVTVPKDY